MLGLRRRTANADVSSPPAAGIDADLSGATISGQVAIGEHIVQIQAAPGARVTYVAPGERPVLRLRPLPLRLLTRDFPALVGREDQVAGVDSWLAGGAPVEVWGAAGIGKTVLLRHVAHRAGAAAPEGVVFTACRGQPVQDVLQFLLEACYESDGVFVPTPALLREHLQERRVLVVLDDVELGREQLAEVMGAAPGCLFLSATTSQVVFGEGQALHLGGLETAGALTLLERGLGRALGAGERPAAEAFCREVEGHPLQILQAAALVREGTAGAPPESVAELERALVASLSGRERAVLGPLAAVSGAPLHVDRVAALSGVPDAGGVLESLQERSLVQAHSPRFGLAGGPSPALLDELDTDGWQDRTLKEFASWADADGEALRFPDDTEAVLALLRSGGRAGRWEDVLHLARGADPGLTATGRCGAWGVLLDHALDAARALDDPAAEAWALHQRGSRALCLGMEQAAAGALGQALELRERLGDEQGAAATRHNLDQLGGAGGGPSGGPPRPRPPWSVVGAIAALAAAAALAVALIPSSRPGDDRVPTPASAPAPVPRPEDRNTGGGGAAGGGTTTTATPVAAVIDRTSLAFPNQPLRTTSDPQPITVANDSTRDLMLGEVTSNGGDEGFAVDASQCSGRRLAPGESCVVTVTFTPTSLATVDGSVRFADIGDGSARTVGLVGSGCDPRRTCTETPIG